MNNPDNTLITEFSDRVHVEAQQIQARLRAYTIQKQMSGDVWAYDGLGQVEATEIFGRNVKVVFNSIDHTRRKISRRRFALALPIDGSDVRGQLLSPNSEYPRAVRMAMERVYDRVVLESAFADVLTGREFDTSVTFAADGGSTVDATAGLTYEKILEMNKNYTDNEVGNDMPVDKYLTITGDEEEALMLETELTSGDYSRMYAIDDGEIVKAVGNKLIKYGANVNNPMLEVSGGVRDLVSATKNSFCVGISKEISIEIEKRPDYYETEQVLAIFELGSVRTEGVLVQKVQTTA